MFVQILSRAAACSAVRQFGAVGAPALPQMLFAALQDKDAHEKLADAERALLADAT